MNLEEAIVSHATEALMIEPVGSDSVTDLGTFKPLMYDKIRMLAAEAVKSAKPGTEIDDITKYFLQRTGGKAKQHILDLLSDPNIKNNMIANNTDALIMTDMMFYVQQFHEECSNRYAEVFGKVFRRNNDIDLAIRYAVLWKFYIAPVSQEKDAEIEREHKQLNPEFKKHIATKVGEVLKIEEDKALQLLE